MSAPTIQSTIDHLYEARTLLRLAPSRSTIEVPDKNGPTKLLPTKATAIAHLQQAHRDLAQLITEITAFP